MAERISDIVAISITRTTQAVKQANFGIIMLVDEFDPDPGASPPFTGRVKEYSGDILTALSDDGYTSGDYVYEAATSILSQNPVVDKIKVGAKYITTDADANWTDALNAIYADDPDFYGLSTVSTTVSDQEDIADWAETKKILYGISSDSADVIDGTSTTDIAYYVSNNNLDRSFVYYHSDGEYIAEAAMGERFPKDPGSGTWKFKSLSGIASDDFSASERTAALDKNCNIYVERGGVDMVEEGTVGSGEYIDIMRGIDWLESEIETVIFSELINTEKIPYTDDGVTTIEGLLKQALDEGVQNGVIAEGYEVSVPEVSDISSVDKSARLLPDVEFSATLQGAIHKIEISGVVSI
jgi:hypothetical protein